MMYPLFQEISQWVNPHGTLCISTQTQYCWRCQEKIGHRSKEGHRSQANEKYTFYF